MVTGGIKKHLPDRSHFHHLAGLHDGHPAGQFRDYGQIMGNEEITEALAFLQLPE